MNVGEAKGKVKNKKVEVKKIIGGKKMVKKDGRYVAIWTCGVCKQILPKTTCHKVSCEGCMTWCHLDKCSGLKDKSEHDDTFRCQSCRKKMDAKQEKLVMLKTNVEEAEKERKRKSTEEEIPSPKVSPVGKRIKKNIKEVKTTTQNEKKDEKKANTSKTEMENNLRETIMKTINIVVNKGTETEQVKNMETDIEKKKIGVNKYSYKLKIGDVNLTEEDIQSLGIGQSVTDGIIALDMKLLEEAFETIVKGDRTRLLSPNMTHLFKLGNKMDVMEEKKKLKINESEWVLYPINNKMDDNEISGGTHWSLLLYSKKDRTYYHFDPIESLNEGHAKDMILNTLDYDNFKEGFPSYVEVKCERQKNGYDCGPYIMMYMATILENIRNGNEVNKFNFSSPLPLCKGATKTREWLHNTIKQKIKENEGKDTHIRNVSKDEKSKNDENNTPYTTIENKKNRQGGLDRPHW